MKEFKKPVTQNVEEPENKKEFDYPEEINKLTAIFRIELQPNEIKNMHYHINKNTTKCTIDLSYYISEIDDKMKKGSSISIDFFNP